MLTLTPMPTPHADPHTDPMSHQHVHGYRCRVVRASPLYSRGMIFWTTLLEGVVTMQMHVRIVHYHLPGKYFRNKRGHNETQIEISAGVHA